MHENGEVTPLKKEVTPSDSLEKTQKSRVLRLWESESLQHYLSKLIKMLVLVGIVGIAIQVMEEGNKPSDVIQRHSTSSEYQ